MVRNTNVLKSIGQYPKVTISTVPGKGQQKETKSKPQKKVHGQKNIDHFWHVSFR